MIATARAMMARIAARLNLTCQKRAKPVLFFNLYKISFHFKKRKNGKKHILKYLQK